MPQEPDLQSIFQYRLRFLRHARGLTQTRLAEMAGLSKEFIGLLERGQKSPSLATLEMLARSLSVAPCSLLERPTENTVDYAELPPNLGFHEFVLRVFNESRTGMFVTTTAGKVVLANECMARALGYETVEDFAALTSMERLYADPAERERLVEKLAHSGIPLTFHLDWVRADGSTRPFTIVVFSTMIQGTGYIAGLLRDHEHRLQNGSDHGASELLRELRHRHKNTLNLLYLHLRMLADKASSIPAVEILTKLRALIQTEEFVNLCGNGREASLGTYLAGLAEAMRHTGLLQAAIETSIDCDGARLDHDILSHVGSFVTEAVLNAEKHAFVHATDRAPRIRITCANENAELTIGVCDNGSGLAGGSLPRNGESLGLLILHETAARLNGEFDLSPHEEGGTMARLRFPVTAN